MFLAAIMKTNLGTIAKIDVVPHAKERGTSVCTRIFWSLKAMMDGWQHARPVISIDGTFLKGRYRGKLFIAMSVDSNNHPFPLCYGLVDEETYENWSWFLQRLRRHVCRQRTGVCIISDRAASIISALRDPQNSLAEPLGIHRFCLLHVRSNFCSHHPGGELKKLIWKAGRTTQVSKHDAYMSRIGEISPTALQYLATKPVERWTFYHDSGVRYGQTTTNMLEGFNGNIRRARFLPVTAMMEYLFYKVITIVDKYRNIVDDFLQEGQQLCARSAAMLAKIRRKTTGHTVITFHRLRGIMKILTHQYTTAKWTVKGGKTQVVNLNDRTCTCGKWSTHHMLCSHAMAGCITHGLSWEHFIEHFHKNQTVQDLYRPIIYPLEPTEYWNYDLPVPWQGYGKLVPEESLKKLKKKRGDKGQSVRIRTEINGLRSGKKCSLCNQEGHTKHSKK
ncbi:uncharacterized protein LOC141695386 [Apium graveolens]|uniref:uncharacterized protein LOC141695386 n=1 Tax=Apium graveolens TaxID=4045 RepID=UPI003D7A9C24